MATVRLSDAVIPEVFMSYSTLNNPELTAFWNSGIVASNETLNAITRVGGKEFTVPFWLDLDPNIEPNMSNDDPDDLASPQKLGSGMMKARKAFLNQGWSDMDLVVELAGSDPMQRIASRTNTYWMRQWQRRLIATLQGVYADNVANDNGDMVVAAPTEQFNGDLVIDAVGTMGDAGMRFIGIAVHSKIHTRMVKNDDIVWLPDSQTGLTVPTYKGLRVVIDDNMPILSGSGDTAVYLTVVFGRGATGFAGIDGHVMAMGEGIPKTPMEIDRTPRAGNGGGMEEMWQRKTWMLHPAGFSWIEEPGGTPLTEFSPTLADLRQGGHWNRVVNRKQAPLAFITSRA